MPAATAEANSKPQALTKGQEAPTPATPPTTYKYRLMYSIHIMEDGTKVQRDPNKEPPVFTSPIPLEKFNTPGYAPKFERVFENVQEYINAPPSARDDFDNATKDELIKMLEEEELPYESSWSKAQIKAVLRKHVPERVPSPV